MKHGTYSVKVPAFLFHDSVNIHEHVVFAVLKNIKFYGRSHRYNSFRLRHVLPLVTLWVITVTYEQYVMRHQSLISNYRFVSSSGTGRALYFTLQALSQDNTSSGSHTSCL